jgi:hypothetical protein
MDCERGRGEKGDRNVRYNFSGASYSPSHPPFIKFSERAREIERGSVWIQYRDEFYIDMEGREKWNHKKGLKKESTAFCVQRLQTGDL